MSVDPTEPAVSPDRFDGTGAWAEPRRRRGSPTSTTGWSPRRGAPSCSAAVDALPDRQRDVVLLRDVEGLPSEDVCDVLGISEGNQRVLLHRGRSRLRTALESELQTRGR